MDEFIRHLPKAELHLHIEGTLEPDLMFELAERNGVELPYDSVDDVRSAYEFTDLQSFLDIYYAACSVLQTEEDFHLLTKAYLERAHDQGVRHVEMFFDPQTHTDRGIDFGAVYRGIRRGLDEAEHRVSSGLIMCFLRHLSQEAALDTWARAEPYLDGILGVGLDSGEIGNPPEKFARVFDLAGQADLRRVAHAGEEGPPSYIWAALDTLHVERVDHGVRAVEDEELMDRLVSARIPLTVCPLSNVKLRVHDTLDDHPLLDLMDAGVLVTINSDDPAYFGGYVGDNYQAVADAFELSTADLAELAMNSFIASFLSEGETARWIEEIEVYAEL